MSSYPQTALIEGAPVYYPNSKQRGIPPMMYPQNPETILRYISIEIPTNNTTGKFSFPNNNELNGKRILGISFPDNADDDMKSLSNLDVVPNACIAAAYLEIRRDSDNIIYQVPCKFHQETNGDRSIRPLNIKGFNPQTSFINIVDTTTYETTDAIMITIVYTDK